MKINKITLTLLATFIGFSSHAIASGKYGGHYDSGDGDSYHSEHDTSKGNYYKKKTYKHKEHYYYESYSEYVYPYGDDSHVSGSGDDSSGDHYNDHDNGHEPDDSGAGDGYSHSDGEDTTKRLALRLIGAGEMKEGTVPDYDGDKYPDPAICFDVDLQDIATGEVIGSATDCLSEIMNVGDGLKLIGTTFFYLDGGTIITRGITTVQPVADEPGTDPSSIITPEGREITHITGASSTENAVLKAYGDYAWHQGTVRLSGMVDMANFTGAVGSEIYFDCLFLLNLEEKKQTKPYWWNWYRRHYYQDNHYDEKGDDSKGSYKHESYSSSSNGNHSYRSSTTYSSSSSKGY